jgi:hypothetical protein
MSGPLNYTTQIKAEKTAGECLAILGRSGASAIAITYTDRAPTGLAFRLDTPHGGRDFTLPVNVEGVQKSLLKSYRAGKIRQGFTTDEHARRVAWRIVKDWLEAQLAIIDAQMVTLDEVMLPYLQVDPQHTLYQAYQEREQLALTAGSGA